MIVWVVGRGIPRKKNKMLGSFELEQAQMLKRNGIDVYYICFNVRTIRRWEHFGFHYDMEGEIETVSFNFPIGRVLPNKAKVYAEKIAFDKISRKLIKEKGLPDIIHVHYPTQHAFSVFSTMQLKGVKIVATEHWTKVLGKNLEEPYLSNLKSFVKKADAYCCVGSSLKKAIEEKVTDKSNIIIVPNVVNQVFASSHINHTVHTEFIFLCAGRLVKVKQFDKIAKAFLNVFKEENVKLIIAGGGEELKNIQNIIENKKGENKVCLLGEVSRYEMAELMRDCNVLVTYSRLETFCVPIIEAWACGKPVIATTVTVFSDNPDPRLGIMVDWQDQKTLEEALRRIYETYNTYNPEWIKKYAEDNYSENAIAGKIKDIYSKVME